MGKLLGIPDQGSNKTVEFTFSLHSGKGVDGESATNGPAGGIETGAQFDYLSRNTCDSMQSYLLSQALPKEEIPSILKKRSRGIFCSLHRKSRMPGLGKCISTFLYLFQNHHIPLLFISSSTGVLFRLIIVVPVTTGLKTIYFHF